MAPSGKRRAKSTRKPRRTIQIKKQEKPVVSPSKNSDKIKKIQEKLDVSPTKSLDNHFVKMDGGDFTSVVDDISGCSTPKGKRYRLPEIVSCPPAPMKKRVLTNCSLRRTPIAFYGHPDLELFFVFAFGKKDVSV